MSKEMMEDADRLEEIREEIEGLMDEVERIVKRYPGVKERAMSYWVPHIYGALRKETRWLGGSMMTMDDAIAELRGEDEE